MDEFSHFVEAQSPVYEQVVRELRAGRKQSHWMWFVFPQLRGLGRSAMAERYALDSLDQAARYLAHEVLGSRLRECAELLMRSSRSAQQIFGPVDAMKLHSSLTLFSRCSPPDSVFSRALDRFFAAKPDGNTLNLLGASATR